MKEKNTAYLFSSKDLYKLIIPLIIEQFLNVTVGMADSIMIASVGEAAVSGVSLVDTIMILLINIFAALATGGAVVAGQYIGKKHIEKACIAANQLILFILVLAVFITALVYVFHNWILTGVFGNIEPDVMNHSRIYLQIVTASIPFMAIYNGGAALFRAMGNSKISMKTSILMNVVNIVGNATLIYGFGLGVAGAAIPTLVSRILGAVVMIILLFNQKHMIHIPKKPALRFEKHMIRKILYIGIPNGLENSMFQLGKILVLSLVSAFGTASIAANAVSNTIAMFQILPGMAIGFAVITVVSRCVGAGEYEQAAYYTKKLLKLTYGCLVVVNIVILLALPLIMRLYQLSDITAAMAEKILIYHGICCCMVWPMAFTLPNTLRASNDVQYSMFISIISMWIFRIAFSYVLGKYFGLGVFGVWIAMTIDWLFRAICFFIRYARGKWKTQTI